MTDVWDDRKIIGCSTAFQAFFGNPASGASTIFSPDLSHVEIDIIRGNEKLAAMVPRGKIGRSIGTKSRDLQTGKYTNIARAYPLIEEEGNITADDLLKRLPGEDPYNSAVTRVDRLRWRALSQHMEACRRIIRTFEYLASQSVLTGKMPAILGTSDDDLIYDFHRKDTHTEAVVVPWTDTNAVIFTNIDNMCDLIRADGRITPDFMGLGGQAMDAFINNSKVKEAADNRRFELIEVSTNNPVPPRFNRFVAGGWIPRGRLRTPKSHELWMFTNIDIYDDDSGDPQKYMPEDQALICNCQARCDRYFGPPEVLPLSPDRLSFYQYYFGFNLTAPMLPPNIKGEGSVIMPVMFMPYAYGSVDYTNITHRVQSAPIFATTHTDAFGVLTDLIA
jgi:hypothetical protein